jgi:hypothetical protein
VRLDTFAFAAHPEGSTAALEYLFDPDFVVVHNGWGQVFFGGLFKGGAPLKHAQGSRYDSANHPHAGRSLCGRTSSGNLHVCRSPQPHFSLLRVNATHIVVGFASYRSRFSVRPFTRP